jgi:hypothetical protein
MNDWNPAPQGQDHIGPVLAWIAGSLLCLMVMGQIFIAIQRIHAQ